MSGAAFIERLSKRLYKTSLVQEILFIFQYKVVNERTVAAAYGAQWREPRLGCEARDHTAARGRTARGHLAGDVHTG